MNIIIPIIVEAYLSDGFNVETKRVPQVSPDYSSLLCQSFLGSRNTPVPVDSTMPPLKRGVHLHFILPDAFKKADENGEFPAVPDRYIVTRFITEEGRCDVSQWVVESSFISTDEAYLKSVSIPMFSDSSAVKFRYCGRAYPMNMPPDDKGEYLEKLTAVGGGDPLFAAYYPSCHSIFGFRDDMKNVKEGADVSYFVTGFFASQSNDPFYNVTTADEFAEVLTRMNLSVTDNTAAIPQKSVLFGIAEGIKWTNGTIADKLPTGKIEVAVGKTSAEALSAVTERLISPKKGFFQRFFNALQYSEADKLDSIDGQYLLDDEIVLRQFQRISGENGTYTLTGSDEENSMEAAEFSKIIKDKLVLGKKIRICEGEKKKLFCLWEQYMLLYEDNSTKKEISSRDILEEITNVADHITCLNSVIAANHKSIESRVSNHMTAVGEEPFYLPKEPAVLLCGEGIRRSYAFGENGRYTEDGTLACQRKALECEVSMLEILRIFVYDKPGYLEVYDSLFMQAVLLITETKKIIEKTFGRVHVKGEVSPVAVNSVPGDFISLFMDWNLVFHPLRTSRDTESDNTLSHCFFQYGETNFVTRETPSGREITYYGRSVLTPHATINLKERLQEWVETHGEDAEAAHAAELLDKLPIISQNLGGLNDQLTAMFQAYQFPVMGNGGDEKQAEAVAANMSQTRTSVLTNYPLFPLGGGHFRLSQINIVGTFGQVQQVYVPSPTYIPDTIYSESLDSGTAKFGYLPPGFSIPSRIDFHWLWRDGGYSSKAKETTPIQGFLVPELLNGRLVAYDVSGTALGEVKSVQRNGEKSLRWVSAPGFPSKLPDIPMSGTLKKFLLKIKDDTVIFARLMEVVDRVLEKTLSSGNSGAIWGKTLALSKAEVTLEFFGSPDFTRGFSEFKKYNTLGIEQLKIPLALGDAYRSFDGFVGAFETDNFTCMYPPFGMEGRDDSRYIRYGESLSIANSDKNKLFWILSEVSAPVTLQTGMHPLSSIKLWPEHIQTAEQLTLLADLYPVITPEGEAELSIADNQKKEAFLFNIMQGNDVISWEVKNPDAVVKDTIICDGKIAKVQGGRK